MFGLGPVTKAYLAVGATDSYPQPMRRVQRRPLAGLDGAVALRPYAFSLRDQ